MRALHARFRATRLGFTMLEIVVAMLIFFTMMSAALVIMSASTDQGIAAQNARELRMLAEAKLGEVAIFEEYYNDEFGPDKSFDNLPEGLRDRYRDWKWGLDIRDVTVFGVKNDDNAPYLFGEPAEAKTTESADGGAAAPTTGKKREPLLLRQLVVTVTVPAESGEDDGDSIEIVTFLPLPPAKGATPAGGTR